MASFVAQENGEPLPDESYPWPDHYELARMDRFDFYHLEVVAQLRFGDNGDRTAFDDKLRATLLVMPAIPAYSLQPAILGLALYIFLAPHSALDRPAAIRALGVLRPLTRSKHIKFSNADRQKLYEFAASGFELADTALASATLALCSIDRRQCLAWRALFDPWWCIVPALAPEIKAFLTDNCVNFHVDRSERMIFVSSGRSRDALIADLSPILAARIPTDNADGITVAHLLYFFEIRFHRHHAYTAEMLNDLACEH